MNKIIILHGWTYSTDKWTNFVELLKKSGFIITVLKIPGLTEESNEVWDLEKYSKWLLDKLSKENEKVILLGQSNGGRIAGYFASKYPDKVRDLILIDSVGIYHKDLYIRIKRSVFGAAAKIGGKIMSSDFSKRVLYRLAGETDYYKAAPNMKKTMINLTNYDLRETFGKINTPTLIIWGRNDKITPLSDGILINKLIKNSKLEVVEGAKHSPYFTHPNEVLEIIKNGI